MQCGGTGENDFTRLYAQLQQSTAASTNAFRVTLNKNFPGSWPHATKCSSKRDKIGSSSGDDVKVSSPNGECDPIRVPHIYLNGGVLKTPTDGKTRKVYFAQPLSTIKIKSPTPLHGWEDSGDGWHYDQAWSSDLDEDDEENSSTDLNDVHDGGTDRLNESDDYVTVTRRKSKKSRRKQRRRERLALDNMYNVITDYLEDPNAEYEVEVNEDDYEFVSEIRLCESQERKSRIGNACERDKLDSQLQNLETDQVLVEMKKIYGDIGADRILKMEKRIEADFHSFKLTH